METSFASIVWHGKLHIHTKYDHIIIKQVMVMVMILFNSFESHECSYMIGHFVKTFFSKVMEINLYYFSWQIIHNKRNPCQRISFFYILFHFYEDRVKITSTTAHSKGAEYFNALYCYCIGSYLIILKLFFAIVSNILVHTHTCSSILFFLENLLKMT